MTQPLSPSERERYAAAIRCFVEGCEARGIRPTSGLAFGRFIKQRNYDGQSAQLSSDAIYFVDRLGPSKRLDFTRVVEKLVVVLLALALSACGAARYDVVDVAPYRNGYWTNVTLVKVGGDRCEVRTYDPRGERVAVAVGVYANGRCL